MEDFILSPLEIPFYQDDPFPLQDTIFQYLQHHATSSNSLLTSVLPHPVFTEAAATPTTTAAAAGRGATTTTTIAAATTTTKAASTTTSNKKGKRGRTPSKVKDYGSVKPSDGNGKSILHKEVERGRRNEMAKLYASLKKLLPVEYIKVTEKSALPDHIREATNYIKHKEETIRELEMKRNKLKTQLGADMGDANGQVARSFSSTITFRVESCSDGSTEILMKSDLADDWFPLSRVLNVLLKEGLAVLTYSYTKLNQKLHCTIRTDVGAGRKIDDADLCLLREKLEAKVAEWKSSSSRSS